MSINKVILLGRADSTPYLYFPERGKCVARFRLATEQGGNTVWHSLVLYGELAERAEKEIQKGALLDIEGELRYYAREFAEEVIYSAEVRVNAFQVVMMPISDETRNEIFQETKRFVVDMSKLFGDEQGGGDSTASENTDSTICHFEPADLPF